MGSGGITQPFLTSALDGGEWSLLRPGHLTPPGKIVRNPFDRRLVGPQNRSGRHGGEKDLAPAGNRTPAMQLYRLSYLDSKYIVPHIYPKERQHRSRLVTSDLFFYINYFGKNSHFCPDDGGSKFFTSFGSRRSISRHHVLEDRNLNIWDVTIFSLTG
jgi:hypothetical protein